MAKFSHGQNLGYPIYAWGESLAISKGQYANILGEVNGFLDEIDEVYPECRKTRRNITRNRRRKTPKILSRSEFKKDLVMKNLFEALSMEHRMNEEAQVTFGSFLDEITVERNAANEEFNQMVAAYEAIVAKYKNLKKLKTVPTNIDTRKIDCKCESKDAESVSADLLIEKGRNAELQNAIIIRDGEICQLRLKVQQKEEELRKSEDEVYKLRHQFPLRLDVSTETNDLPTKTTTCGGEVKLEKRIPEEKITKYEDTIKNVERERDHLKCELGCALENTDELKYELGCATKNIEDLNCELDSARERIDELTRQIETIEHVEIEKSETYEKSSQAEEVNRPVPVDDMSEVGGDQTARERLTELEEIIDEYENRLQEVEMENQSLLTAREENMAEIRRLENDVDHLKRMYETSVKKTDKLSSENIKLQTDLDDERQRPVMVDKYVQVDEHVERPTPSNSTVDEGENIEKSYERKSSSTSSAVYPEVFRNQSIPQKEAEGYKNPQKLPASWFEPKFKPKPIVEEIPPPPPNPAFFSPEELMTRNDPLKQARPKHRDSFAMRLQPIGTKKEKSSESCSSDAVDKKKKTSKKKKAERAQQKSLNAPLPDQSFKSQNRQSIIPEESRVPIITGDEQLDHVISCLPPEVQEFATTLHPREIPHFVHSFLYGDYPQGLPPGNRGGLQKQIPRRDSRPPQQEAETNRITVDDMPNVRANLRDENAAGAGVLGRASRLLTKFDRPRNRDDRGISRSPREETGYQSPRTPERPVGMYQLRGDDFDAALDEAIEDISFTSST